MPLARPASYADLLLLVVIACLLSACSPALDWREVRPADSGVLLLLPCKPSGQERRVALAGQPVKLALHACAAGGQTWGFVVADVGDPGRVAAALRDLGNSAAANVSGAVSRAVAHQVPGATPNPGSHRLRIQGKLPDGKPVHMEVLVFTHGTRVFQATVLGGTVPDEAADTYFSALRVEP